jgi:hypothetical protein
MSFEGISVANAPPGTNEVCLAVLLIINVSLLAPSLNRITVEATIKAMASVMLSPEAFKLMYPGWFFQEPRPVYEAQLQPNLIWSRGKAWAGIISVFVYLLQALGAILFVVGTRVIIYRYIWLEPYLPNPTVSYGLVLLSIFVDFALIILMLFGMLPLPYRDISWLKEVEIMEQVAPERLPARRREAYRDSIEDRERMIEQGYLSPDP